VGGGGGGGIIYAYRLRPLLCYQLTKEFTCGLLICPSGSTNQRANTVNTKMA